MGRLGNTAGKGVARDIGLKLRATAALVGAVTRKDLAAEFRRVNPMTSFDVDRAHKWMQGRAHPRELRLYEDWAKVVGLERSGAWIAECPFEDFVKAICTRHNYDRDALERQIELSRRSGAARQEEPSLSLVGTYACYSHAWSPYFGGQLIRGEMSIARPDNRQKLVASYAERLPTSRLQLEGPLALSGRALYLDLSESGGDARMLFCLFSPAPPVSVLAGYMCGATIIDPDARPSVTRIAMVRLPGPSMRLRSAVAYLPSKASVAGDLATLGLQIPSRAAIDEGIGRFLTGGQEGGLDQVDSSSYRALVDLLNPIWLDSVTAMRRVGDA